MSLDRKFLEAQMLYEKKIKDLEAKLAEKDVDLLALDTENYSFKQQIDNLKQQLAEKDQIIENLQTTYQSVMQTCGNDANEIKRLREQLAKQESTITNLIEDNRASQEWYKMQLAEVKNSCDYYMNRANNLLQDKISFAVDILEELADYSNYINSKLDFECGSYVSEKAIRDKIKYLKGKKDE